MNRTIDWLNLMYTKLIQVERTAIKLKRNYLIILKENSQSTLKVSNGSITLTGYETRAFRESFLRKRHSSWDQKDKWTFSKWGLDREEVFWQKEQYVQRLRVGKEHDTLEEQTKSSKLEKATEIRLAKLSWVRLTWALKNTLMILDLILFLEKKNKTTEEF